MIAQSAPNTQVTGFDVPSVIAGPTKHLATDVPDTKIATVAGHFLSGCPSQPISVY